MGLFKTNKKKTNEIVIRICPQCMGRNVKYYSGGSGFFGPPTLKCSECGFKGPIYVDGSSTTDEEELEIKMLREEFPEYIKEQAIPQDLAKICLENKWIPDQQNNHHNLRSWCPFCEDANVVCSICSCPNQICAKHATEGLIGRLNELYDDDIELCQVDSNIYNQIIEEFQKVVNS